MPKEDIKKIVKSSKSLVDKDSDGFAESIRKDLESFKTKALK